MPFGALKRSDWPLFLAGRDQVLGGKEPNALRGIETHQSAGANVAADTAGGKEPNALRGIEITLGHAFYGYGRHWWKRT